MKYVPGMICGVLLAAVFSLSGLADDRRPVRFLEPRPPKAKVKKPKDPPTLENLAKRLDEVEERLGPHQAESVTELEKKYLSSNTPRDDARYLPALALEIVDSCKSSCSAMSCSTSGCMDCSPFSKNAC